MSLSLDLDTMPRGINAKIHPLAPLKLVLTGPGLSAEIGMQDLLSLAYYALTNNDLEPNDPRVQFMACMKKMKTVTGFNGSPSQRLVSTVGPIPR